MNLKLRDIFMFAYVFMFDFLCYHHKNNFLKRRDFKILEIRNNEVRGK